MNEEEGVSLVPMRVIRWNLVAIGVQLEEASRAAKLPLAARNALSYDEAMQLWNAVEELTGDPHVGLRAGREIRLHELGPLGALVGQAENLQAALVALLKVVPAAVPGTLEEVPRGDRQLELAYRRPPSTTRSRHGVEALFANIVAFLRYCSRTEFALAEVGFDNPRPVRPGVFSEFFGVDVRWSAPWSHLVFSAETLAIEMTGADEGTEALLSREAPRLVDSEHLATEIERRASSALTAALQGGAPTSLAATARRLGVSARTLQRHLGVVGVSFRRLRSHVLGRYARTLLDDHRLDIGMVGQKLGYARRASFERAFFEWTGQTPAQYRRCERYGRSPQG